MIIICDRRSNDELSQLESVRVTDRSTRMASSDVKTTTKKNRGGRGKRCAARECRRVGWGAAP